jgi:16S rRNA (guanine(966)-N(2))-methyltransferase RsmD
VRQTLFDILAPEIPGSRFLDAFAGGGAVGFEALSRGAEAVVLVEQDATAVAAIRENARALANLGQVEVVRQDVATALLGFSRAGRRFDIVYLDPPYDDSDMYERVLHQLGDSTLLEEGGLLAVEHFHKRELPGTIGHLGRTRSVKVGDHRLSFYRLTTVDRP